MTQFFQLFTLKFLCKLVDLTKSYVRKQKGAFFPNTALVNAAITSFEGYCPDTHKTDKQI